jgi:hypothetical protein
MASGPSAKPPSKAVVYAVIGFFLLAGLGMIGGGFLAWHDEHSGTAGTAHVYRCYHHISRAAGGPDCYARWTYKGRIATGYVENANTNQVGKDVSVRIHGTGHVTEQTYWVPIGLWVMGLLVIAVFAMVLVQFRRRQALGATSSVEGSSPPMSSLNGG